MGTATGHDASLDHLKSFLALHRGEIGTVVVYAAAVGVLVLATPVAVQSLVSTAAFGTVLQPIVVIATLLLGGLVFAGVLRALKSLAVEVLQQRMFVQATAQLARSLPRHDPAARFPGYPIHRYFDLFGAQKAASTLLLGGIDVLLSAGVGMLVLAFYHPVLLAFDAGLLLALAGLVFLAGRGGVKSAIEESSAKLALSDFLADVAATPYAFRDRRGRSYARASIDALAQRYLRERAQHFRVVMRQLGGAVALQAIASAALLGLGGWLVIERELTLGQLVAAELIVSAVLASLSDFGKYAETYYDLTSNLYKLNGLLSIPLERDEAAGESERRGTPCELVLDGLTLSLGGRALLDGASARIAPGARVALVGAAESGKTTLVELLFGVHRQQRGRVLVDGIDTRELSLDALRERVALVRGAELVPGSVLENVRLGDETIPPARVRSLLDALGLSDELGRLPRGLETPLGLQGERISESQAFRLTLARALVREPGLVAIDTDGTAIDAPSWERIVRVLTQPGAPWTLVAVGAHPALRAVCGETLRLADGKLTTEVAHDAG